MLFNYLCCTGHPGIPREALNLTFSCPSRCTVPTLNSSHAAGIGAPYVRQCKAWVSNPQAACSSSGCIFAAGGHIYNLSTYYKHFTIFQAVVCTTCCYFSHVQHANWPTITGLVLCHEKFEGLSLKGCHHHHHHALEGLGVFPVPLSSR